MHRIFSDIVTLFFPRACVLCGKHGNEVCLLCRSALFKNAPIRASAHENIYSCLPYKDEQVKQLVWLFKYRNMRPLASFFGECIYERMLPDLSDQVLFSNFKDPVLVPIPLSKKRMRYRGFNQSEEIAREIQKRYKECELETAALCKIKETAPQMSIKNKKERLENIVGCFAVPKPEKIAGRNIILIDDITTTGATLHEAEVVIRDAGARSVSAYTVAH